MIDSSLYRGQSSLMLASLVFTSSANTKGKNAGGNESQHLVDIEAGVCRRCKLKIICQSTPLCLFVAGTDTLQPSQDVIDCDQIAKGITTRCFALLRTPSQVSW